jgi:hypothetical protein
MSKMIFMKLYIYIYIPESISSAHFINPSISNTNISASQISEAKPYYFTNACTNLHETWYAYHAT